MKKVFPWLALPILVAGGVYLMLLYSTRLPLSPQPTATPSVAANKAGPDASIHYPIATRAASSPATGQEMLPSLLDSDGVVLDALTELLKTQSFIDRIYPDGIIRRIVATVDNLPRETGTVKLRWLKPVDGTFRTSGGGVALVMAPSNAERYGPYIRMMQAINAHSLVSVYVRFYPLFQQAYEDVGYPKGYFNDRLIAVVDHFLACPEAPATLRLVQSHIDFDFADPALEHMSTGDKILFRIGKTNAAKVKRKLREIRAELISRSDAIL